MCLDATKELAGRTSLADRATAISSLKIPNADQGKNVFSPPYTFVNKQDFAARVGITGANNIKTLEAKFCQISYLNFVDTKEGNADCAVININYEIHVAWQFLEVRADLTHSYNDFIGLTADFISAFTKNKRLADKIYLKNFVQNGNVVLDGISKFLPGVTVSFVNFQATIEYR